MYVCIHILYIYINSELHVTTKNILSLAIKKKAIHSSKHTTSKRNQDLVEVP